MKTMKNPKSGDEIWDRTRIERKTDFSVHTVNGFAVCYPTNIHVRFSDTENLVSMRINTGLAQLTVV